MLLTKLFALLLTFTPGAEKAIVLDGQFDDWADVPVVIADPLDAPDAPLDIFEIRIAHDEAFVHVFADLTRDVCIQQLNGMLHMVLDVDGDTETGLELHGLPGADIVITLSPLNRSFGQERHMGVGLVSLTYQPDPEDPSAAPLTPYDIGFAFAPTYASSKFEFRIERSAILPKTPPLFTDNAFRMKLVHTDFSGDVLDQTEVIEQPLTVAPVARAASMPRPVNTDVDPLARAHGTDVRIVSFNAQNSRILQDAERAGRVMEALDADVILFQELTDRTRPDDIESLLNRHAPPTEGRWHVRIGDGGGNLRCGVATHLPFEAVERLRLVPHANREDFYVRQEALLITPGEQRLLVMSIHLRCCGGATGPEEEARMMEVEQLRSAIDPLHETLELDGLVIGGDFNLVGTRRPLERLTAKGDVDGTALTPTQPLQLDKRTNTTWSDASQPFVPGRLDYVVVSDATLDVKKSFVFDTADLSHRWLEHHGLIAEDSLALSDHRPIVLDLAWRKPAEAATPAPQSTPASE